MKDEVIENGSILIEDGKIMEVGKDIIAPLDAEVIDAEGRMITPRFYRCPLSSRYVGRIHRF